MEHRSCRSPEHLAPLRERVAVGAIGSALRGAIRRTCATGRARARPSLAMLHAATLPSTSGEPDLVVKQPLEGPRQDGLGRGARCAALVAVEETEGTVSESMRYRAVSWLERWCLDEDSWDESWAQHEASGVHAREGRRLKQRRPSSARARDEQRPGWARTLECPQLLSDGERSIASHRSGEGELRRCRGPRVWTST